MKQNKIRIIVLLAISAMLVLGLVGVGHAKNTDSSSLIKNAAGQVGKVTSEQITKATDVTKGSVEVDADDVCHCAFFDIPATTVYHRGYTDYCLNEQCEGNAYKETVQIGGKWPAGKFQDIKMDPCKVEKCKRACIKFIEDDTGKTAAIDQAKADTRQDTIDWMNTFGTLSNNNPAENEKVTVTDGDYEGMSLWHNGPFLIREKWDLKYWCNDKKPADDRLTNEH